MKVHDGKLLLQRTMEPCSCFDWAIVQLKFQACKVIWQRRRAHAHKQRVQVLFELCRFRNHHPAFNGTFELLDTIPDIKESTVLIPPTSYVPTPISPVAGSPTSSLESQTDGTSGALGREFLTEVVLDKNHAPVEADSGNDVHQWCAPRCFSQSKLLPNSRAQQALL
jgi:hypothetical protein